MKRIPQMTSKSDASPIDGILLLNKSQGMTSNTALQKAKRLLGAKKAGHTGSLDPLATGMLPLCFGEATKVCQYLLDADKCYETTGLLGIKTTTSDSMGEVIHSVDAFSIDEVQLQSVLMHFRGDIKQVPSMFSALKHQGRPLYHFARQGIDIEREARAVLISQLTLDAFDGRQFSLTVCCSKGTYIRNLVEDIGDELQVGAHVTRLHRLYTAGFQNTPMHSLEELEAMSLDERKACLIPMDKAVNYLRSMTLSDEQVTTLRQGRWIATECDDVATTIVRLYNEQSQFIGLGEQLPDGYLKAKRLVSFVSCWQ